MFVLSGKEARAEFRDQAEIDTVVRNIVKKGYRPILRSMLTAACDAVGVNASNLPVTALLSDLRMRRRPASNTGPIGDVFFFNDHLFLITPRSKKLLVWEVRFHTSPSELEQTLELLETLAKSCLDGRRVRGMSFDWKDVKPTLRRTFMRPRRFHEDRLSTKELQYTEEELRQSKLLVSQNNRDFLLSLAQLGKARSKDTATLSNNEVTEPLLDALLIRKEFLVICKQDSRTICSVPSTEHLGGETGKAIRCTTCGRKLSDELIQEIYALAEGTRALLNGSHWMTIWITDLLKESGVPNEKIKWNAAAGDDELDIVANVQGMTIFFELKDREFGLGDAYPFSFRVERYGGDVGVVLTMDKVASEAKKFISEQSLRPSGKIEILEGEEGITANLSGLVDGLSKTSVEMFFFEYAEELGVGVVPIIQEWLLKKRP
jgi:hypothetical protein